MYKVVWRVVDSVNSAQALDRACSDMDVITPTCPETEDSIASSVERILKMKMN